MAKHVLEHREDDNRPGYWYLVIFDDESNSIEKVTARCEEDIYK